MKANDSPRRGEYCRITEASAQLHPSQQQKIANRFIDPTSFLFLFSSLSPPFGLICFLPSPFPHSLPSPLLSPPAIPAPLSHFKTVYRPLPFTSTPSTQYLHHLQCIYAFVVSTHSGFQCRREENTNINSGGTLEPTHTAITILVCSCPVTRVAVCLWVGNRVG